MQCRSIQGKGGRDEQIEAGMSKASRSKCCQTQMCVCMCKHSNGVVRVGGRRVATNAANFTRGDVVGVVLDADQGEIVFFRNGECVWGGGWVGMSVSVRVCVFVCNGA
jgi:hypothetical protein